MANTAIVKRATEGAWLDVLGMKIKFLSGEQQAEKNFSSMLNTVPKATGAPLHSHPWDEAFYVLKGVINLTVDGCQHTISSGDYALIPANTEHAFEGVSEQEGLLLIFDVPSHSHAFFSEIHQRVQTLPDDLHLIPEIGDKHQVRFAS